MTGFSHEIEADSITPPELEPIRLRTLVLLRWFAITGQLAAVFAARIMGIQFPIGPVLALIAAAAIINLWQMLKPHQRMSASQTAGQLSFDLIQLSALIGLTGGLVNPFGLLVLAPVTVAATVLDRRRTLALGIATIILITLASVLAVPLHDATGTELSMAPILLLGHWVALVIGVVFFAVYAHRVAAELKATSTALFATQMALSREQRLQHLGGVVAAAAHEMGTPLATIKLIAGNWGMSLRTGRNCAPMPWRCATLPTAVHRSCAAWAARAKRTCICAAPPCRPFWKMPPTPMRTGGRWWKSPALAPISGAIPA